MNRQLRTTVNWPLIPNVIVRKYLRLCKAFYTCRETFTDVMSALQIAPFLTNKANFLDDQMNVSSFITTNYEQRAINYEIKNKAKTNPIQSQFEPNTKPIRTQFKPNTKPILTQFKPKQTQFHTGSRVGCRNNPQDLSIEATKMEKPNMTNRRDFLSPTVLNTAPAVKKFHLILVLNHPIMFNSGSNCEMDMAAAFAKESKMAARQEGKQNFWTR